MIVIRIEMWPNGDQIAKTHLGSMTITNDGKGSARVSHYDCEIKAHGITKNSRVENFERSTRSVWSLVGLALKAAGFTTNRNAKPIDSSQQMLFEGED